MSYTFRAIWPITDPSLPFTTLAARARPELRLLLGQAHAKPIGPGRWSFAESTQVPGSGRITDWVLIYECPALRTPVRSIPTHPSTTSATHQAGDTAA